MCIIACTPAGLKLDKATFDQCWSRNPDGFGMTYLYEGKIRIKKTMDRHQAWNIYNGVCNTTMDSWKILHFRIGTHGTKDISNCHPFMIHDDLVFAHNGVIRQIPDCPDKLLSDTQMFNNLILKHLPKDFYKWEHYRMLIEDYIGYSKLTFLDTDNSLYIFNSEKGEWSDGVWFSNTSYKIVVPAPVVLYKPYQSNVKSIADMTDEEFSAHCKGKYGDDFRTPTSSWRDKAPVDSTIHKQCEYCMAWKSSGTDFLGIGYLCQDCVDDLTEMGIPLEGRTYEQVISDIWGLSKQEEKKPEALAEEKTIIIDGCEMPWQDYYDLVSGRADV